MSVNYQLLESIWDIDAFSESDEWLTGPDRHWWMFLDRECLQIVFEALGRPVCEASMRSASVAPEHCVRQTCLQCHVRIDPPGIEILLLDDPVVTLGMRILKDDLSRADRHPCVG